MAQSQTARELHPLEVKVLLHFKEGQPVTHAGLINSLGYNLGQANQALSWLAAKGFAVETGRTTRTLYEITDFGRDSAARGTVEQRISALVKDGGALALPQIAEKLSLEPKDVGSAFGGLSKDKVLAMDGEKRATLAPGGWEIVTAREASIQSLLSRAEAGPLDEASLTPPEKELAGSQAKKRGAAGSLFRVAERDEPTFAITPEGAAAGTALTVAGTTGEETGALTPEMLKTGAWKNLKFRRYNIDVPPTRMTVGRSNPYCAFVAGLKDKLASLGFEEFDGPLVETEFWNGDALFMPQFHSARDIHDVYYVKEPTHAKTIQQPWLDQVAATHENGWKTGSRGWNYAFDRDFTRRLILRSQGTVLSAKTLPTAKVPGKYFGVVRCFRYDKVDATHLADFYQTEGIVLGDEVNLRTLLGLLKMFAEEVAMAKEVRYVPGFFPFTEPSVEVHIKHPTLGWFELGGSGIFRPEVTEPLGIKVPVLAWGLGIDRMALSSLGLHDIRDLFTNSIEDVRSREEHVAMPKIDVNEELFFKTLGRRYEAAEIAELLTVAKAELDDWPKGEGVLRIELNDTNRPDLWSTMGLARQLAVYLTGKTPAYGFFSRAGDTKDSGDRRVVVDAGLKTIRPYIGSFVAEGREMTDTLLREIIQSQEKLCGNYGRKRKTIAMGVSRADLVSWPVSYSAADPDTTRFIPLDFETLLTMRQILTEHPKGKEYGHIVAGHARFPLLADARGEVLTFPPVINSALIGGVKTGDRRLFVDLTGPDLDSVLTACAIAACDFSDMGFTIRPVRVEYPWDTPYGRTIVTPFYFQKETVLVVAEAAKRLGASFTSTEAAGHIRRMGSGARAEGANVIVTPPEYRNDFLHPVDAIEEIMIGRGMASFPPVLPRDFTVGRLSAAELYNRRVREIMIGLGYQEMIYGYLGSQRDFVERMGRDGAEAIVIANPMTEAIDMVRDSILPNLLASEAESAHAAYPHRIFETGKTAVRDASENEGTHTYNTLGLMVADREAGFNEVDAHVLALFFYLSVEPTLAPVEDPRFIPGRCAEIRVQGRRVGIMGEIHPEVLSRWGIEMPCAAAELRLDLVRGE